MLLVNVIIFLVLAVLAALLFFRRENVLPNKILALILMTPALNFISNVNTLAGNLAQLPFIYFLTQITGFAFAPLVHMYVLLMTGETINRRHPLYIISAPAMLTGFLFAIDFAFAMSPGEKENFFDGVQNGPYPVQMVIINSIFILLQQVYFTIAAIHIFRYRRRLADTVSNYETTKVQYVTVFILLIWILNILTIAAYILLPAVQVEYIVLPSILAIISIFIIYYGFRYKSIFTKSTYRLFLSTNLPGKNINAAKDKHSALHPHLGADSMEPANGSEIMRAIEEHLDHSESFTNPELTLNELANEIGLPSMTISHAIKNSGHKSFYNYILNKRLAKAKSLESITQDHQSIAKLAGFRNTESLKSQLARRR